MTKAWWRKRIATYLARDLPDPGDIKDPKAWLAMLEIYATDTDPDSLQYPFDPGSEPAMFDVLAEITEKVWDAQGLPKDQRPRALVALFDELIWS